ncbi:MAG: hypothetical protein ACRDL7_08125, partial [Gaiellaceae bacterium]
ASADALHVGFFADDFHFLDVARRVPWWRTLGGAYGIYPWYRPLSRELYFALISPFGSHAPLAAHAVSLVCLAAAAWLLFDLARRVVGERMAWLAPALFVTCEYTRFVTAWASGFQDLLAVALTLLALFDHARRRHGRTALWIALAALAKETGFVALPLVLLDAWFIEGERRPRRWMMLPALAALAAAALHALVRLGWHGAGSAAVIRASAADLAAALLAVAAGFVGRSAVLVSATIALAALSGAAAAALAMRAREAESSAARRAIPFAAIAAALGLAPLVLGSALHLTLANPYYAFPALPWISLLAAALASRAPRAPHRTLAIGIPAVVAWNVLTLGFLPPSPLEDSAWIFRRWDWHEAERLSVISSRLEADLRLALPARPESLVVLYAGLPTGSFFQSEDGPATRVALGDASARAYYLNGVPL